MTKGRGASSGLTPMQKAYAEARVSGMGQTDAAEQIGASRPAEWASRTERKPAVKAYMLSLRHAATVLAASKASDEQVEATPVALTGNALPVVADLAEALGHASRLMRSNVTAQAIREDGTVDIEALRNAPPGVLRKYKAKSRLERDPEGEKGATREIEEVAFETESTLTAAQTLIRHYDAMDTPQVTPVVERTVVLAIMGDDTARSAMETIAARLAEAR